MKKQGIVRKGGFCTLIFQCRGQEPLENNFRNLRQTRVDTKIPTCVYCLACAVSICMISYKLPIGSSAVVCIVFKTEWSIMMWYFC